MTKAELATAIAAKTALNKKSAEETLQAVLDTIADAVWDGDKVTLAGFGSFVLAERKARTGRNPRTGEEVQIKARKVPKFIPAKQFKELVK